jgi:hypothetical protein
MEDACRGKIQAKDKSRPKGKIRAEDKFDRGYNFSEGEILAKDPIRAKDKSWPKGKIRAEDTFRA